MRCLILFQLGICSWKVDLVNEIEGKFFHLFQVVIVCFQIDEVFLAAIKQFGDVTSHSDFPLDTEVLECLCAELVLGHLLAAFWAWRRSEGKDAVDARFAHLVVARADKQPQARVEVTVCLALRALVFRGGELCDAA